MKIKDLADNLRPRERMQKHGPEALSDSELLAIILQKGTKKDSILNISNKLLSDKGFTGLREMSIVELRKISGIGLVKALQIKALFELNKRINQINHKMVKISKPKDVYDYMKDALKNLKQEHFFVLSLDTKNQIISEKVIAIGTLNAALVHPREIFKEAIKNSANSIIIVHNHPSGDPTPSEEDFRFTKELLNSSNYLGIEVLDHVIIGNKSHWSWKENNQ